jgi:Methylase involved in ubiquinone/menaquinone biosynthesis
MSELYNWVFKDLNLKDKVILDAAVGAGWATRFWAEQVHEQGGTSKIISIDNDFPGEWKEKIMTHLGEYGKYVQLKEADIFDLPFDSESMDIVNCDDTLVFLNPAPLKLLTALKEFHRVLKPSRDLIITSEIPLNFEDPEDEGQWRRWNLAKAVYDLKGETWSTEPGPGEVKFALEILGFDVYDQKIFPKTRNTHTYLEGINEWKEIMLNDISKLQWDGLKDSLTRTVNETYEKVKKDEYMMNAPMYVLKCKKGIALNL